MRVNVDGVNKCYDKSLGFNRLFILYKMSMSIITNSKSMHNYNHWANILYVLFIELWKAKEDP